MFDNKKTPQTDTFLKSVIAYGNMEMFQRYKKYNYVFASWYSKLFG